MNNHAKNDMTIMAGESDGLVRARRLIGLSYLSFVYLPLLFWPEHPRSALVASLIATALFLPLYFANQHAPLARRPLLAIAVAALGYLLLPWNPGGNTFVIYAVAMLAARLPAHRLLVASTLLLALLALEYAFTLPRFSLVAANTSITVLISAIIVAVTLLERERERRNAELRLTQDEVKRLATMAERERIGRDLHDLLGHTLSVVALKSELAGRLIEHDAPAARAQIGEVQKVARAALAQVREAVTGIRAGSIDAELAAARLALLSAGVHLDQRCALPPLPAPVEAALALSLREAITNVIRHAQAHAVEIDCAATGDGGVQMIVSDDGRGGVESFGNGLSGLRERMRAIGGALLLESPAGGGTRLCFRLPASVDAGA